MYNYTLKLIKIEVFLACDIQSMEELGCHNPTGDSVTREVQENKSMETVVATSQLRYYYPIVFVE
jgi:hypothetical protein